MSPPTRWAAASARLVARRRWPVAGPCRASGVGAKSRHVSTREWVNGHVVCRRPSVRRRKGAGRARGAGRGRQGQARRAGRRVRGLRRREGRYRRRHADPRHHRLPRPFAVGRRGQSRCCAGSHERRPARRAQHGADAQHAGRRHHGRARLRRQGLYRIRHARRLQRRQVPRTDHALRRPHDLHDWRPRQPDRTGGRWPRRGGEGGARAGPCRLRPGQDHGDRRRHDSGRQSRGCALFGRGDEGRHQRGAPFPQMLRQPCPGRARHPERRARRHRIRSSTASS